ncbi:RNA-guided endonuclease TnpB family protein, partial [Lactobacillus helveticus]
KYLKKSYTGKSTIRITGKRYLKIPKLGYVKTSKTGVLQKKYSRHRHLVKLLVLQNKNKRVLCPRSLESFTNWQKAQKSKAKYQAKAANQCRDYLHKLTTHLVKQYNVIAIEDLKTKNLQKNHHLVKSIANASWRMFRQMLEYKCEWYGKKLIAV